MAPLVLTGGSWIPDFPIDGWEVLGFLGQALFFSRFIVQWIASERRKQVTIPVAFWWLSIAGSSLLATYFWFRPHPSLPGVIGMLPNSIIYLRNLQLERRQSAAQPKS